MDNIMNILTIVLPFTNEIANVLTSTGYKYFENLYKPCIDDYLIDDKILKHINNKKICKSKDYFNKIIIDLIALLGIILNICRNTLENGYYDGILSGINIVFFSFIFPNLFLHKIINYFVLKSKSMKLIVGLIIIFILMIITFLIEKVINLLV